MRWAPAPGHLLAAIVVGLVACVLAFPVFAQTGVEVRLLDARLAPDGDTRLLVNVEGLEGTVLDASAFSVLEDGQPIEGLEVEPLTDTVDVPILIALPFDISGSVDPVFDEIRSAAVGFVENIAGAGIEVALIPFASDVEVTVPPTASASSLVAGIDDLTPGGATLLYDAIVLSAEVIEQRFEGEEGGIARIVVFSDGGDNGSEATLEEAIAAAQGVDAPITTVGWEAEDFDPVTMTRMAEATGGVVVSSEDAGDVAGLFEGIATDITSLYRVDYHSTITAPADLPVTVIVDTPAGEASIESLAINTRQEAAEPGDPTTSILPQPVIAFFGGPTGLWVGVGAAFLAVLGLLWVLLVGSARSSGGKSLERGLRMYGREGRRVRDDDIELPTRRLTERAIDLVGRVPKPEGFDERMQLSLDRAAWPVRSNEFVVLVVASAALGGLLAGGIPGNIWLGILGAVIAGLVPIAILRIRIERRKRAFMDQLPATLQLLAGSLRAGYGLLQAIDTVVQEAEDPTASEFARVLTEARLGMPIDDSLEGMAQRLDSDDFHWVVLAIGIQREVGGNLAELLQTVAATMRSRAALRRQIKVLSAEGRISAWVIGLMPFIVALALQVLNPGYVGQLFERIEGLIMVGIAALLLLVGAFWLKKIVDIEV